MDKYADIDESITKNIAEMKQIFKERKNILIKQNKKKNSDLDFFYNTEFNPLCCKKQNKNYSSSGGCACTSLKNKNFLTDRGNNSTTI